MRDAADTPSRRTTTISAGIKGGTAHRAPPGPKTAMIPAIVTAMLTKAPLGQFCASARPARSGPRGSSAAITISFTPPHR